MCTWITSLLLLGSFYILCLQGLLKSKIYSYFQLQWIQTLKLYESDVYFAFVYISGVKLQKLEWAIFKYYQQAEYEIVTFFKVNNE